MREPPEPGGTAPGPAGRCPLCGRALVPGPSVNEHHWLPRTYGGRETATLHRICHDKIHSVLSEQQLRDYFHTPARLKSQPDIAAFLRWVARKPADYVDGHHKGGPRKRGW